MSALVEETKNSKKLISVLIIEANREMQRLLRAMLLAYDIRNVRIFANSEKAANSMLLEAPDIVLLDWEVNPIDGKGFLKLFRNKKMYPICLVPIIVMFSEAKKNWVESALKLGAHAIIVKPLAPLVLHERMKWALSEERQLKLVGNSYVIDGANKRLAAEEEQKIQMKAARKYQASQFAEMMSIQSDIDKILEVNF